jgi:hypothetical protein
MPKRSSKPRLDVVQNAKRVFDQVIEQTESSSASLMVIGNPDLLSQVMRAMGAKGGRIGGKRRLETLSDARRKQIASDAAKARWAKVKGKTARRPRAKTA